MASSTTRRIYAPYPASSRGLFDHTGRLADLGKFRTPTLRNIAVTGPYMHDGGSIATLGASDRPPPPLGAAHENRTKDKLMHGFSLTRPKIAPTWSSFWKASLDNALLRDPKLADPWSNSIIYNRIHDAKSSNRESALFGTLAGAQGRQAGKIVGRP